MIGNLPSCDADKALADKPLSPRLFRKAPIPKVQEVEDDDEDLKVVSKALSVFDCLIFYGILGCFGVEQTRIGSH